MNRYRVISLILLCLLALSGSWFLQCTQQEPAAPTPPPLLPNSSEVAAVGPTPDGSIKVNNITGVKTEHNASDWTWFPLIVLVQESADTYRMFTLEVMGQENLAIKTDVAASDPCWLKFTKHDGITCTPSRCSAAKAELHLHSLAELH